MRPVTDAELQAYRDNNGIGGTLKSAANAARTWLKNNWEYVAGGAAIIAGGALIATGVGGPVGLMLISAGADTIIQKATTGEVNWGEVAVAGVLGGGAAIAAKSGATGLKATMIAGAYSGAIGGGYSYMRSPGPHSVGGFLLATGEGAGTGALMGGASGAAGHRVASLAGKTLDQVHPSPNLRNLASEIRESGIHPAARNQRVIAVGEDTAGSLHAGSSNGFDKGQREALERLGVNRVPGSGSLHAEEELLRGVPNLQRVGTSRRMPCGPDEHDCAGQLAVRGVEVEQ